MELKILNGALRKRTIFSYSLTAAAFSDVFVVSEDNLKVDFKKVVKIFPKVNKTFHPWLLQCHQHGLKGDRKDIRVKNSKKLFLKRTETFPL